MQGFKTNSLDVLRVHAATAVGRRYLLEYVLGRFGHTIASMMAFLHLPAHLFWCLAHPGRLPPTWAGVVKKLSRHRCHHY